MKVRGIDFVFLRVSDLERSAHFYENILGLRKTKEYKGMWTEFDAGNLTLAVGAINGRAELQKGDSRAAVALAVDNVEKAVAVLKRKGISVVHSVKERGVYFVAVVEDPDGNELILHRRKDNMGG
jgi:predicted enzyme related to lactoylglutathione lyase